jgi:flagellar biogenesis protein FliO
MTFKFFPSMPLIEASSEAASEPLIFWGYTASALTLFILLFISLFLRFRLSKAKRRSAKACDRVALLTSTVIGRSHRLITIKWRGREMLLAVADSKVTLIAAEKVGAASPSLNQGAEILVSQTEEQWI